ncbi:hypothetical protein Cabys_203 [Caldithrix abyssi DSM 13497]|uniref:Uncharacterized protein n=1 Tax=Caldithrix abyssi DSM 13497 TaxID=880073 RepID=A0A1J1C4L1_CALAY|nr:hypothetical protein Cabys_203 [Caldithrix abyssi DSM 13497]
MAYFARFVAVLLLVPFSVKIFVKKASIFIFFLYFENVFSYLISSC